MATLRWWFYPLSLLGAAVSAYVWASQRSDRPIACWTKDCDRIIRSPHSRLLGIHNSVIGLWLFLAMFVMTLLEHLGLEPSPHLASLVIVRFSFIGSMVSLYLTYIQFFVLKGICNWCLTSAALVWTIFILALSSW